jgi:chemosensory pili system protein ChpA (sensor histidine kinase/response regulator)
MMDMGNAAAFDTGPLSWVIAEIRDALGRSRDALREAASLPADTQATALQHAKSHLHQAHGALQIVDVDGVTGMTQAAERAIDRFREEALACTEAQAQVVADAYQAVVEYLEELLGGAPQQATRLFPYYRALHEMLRSERIHPADLLPAALPEQAPVPAAAAPLAADYPAWRARFEKALLPFLKAADPAAQQASARELHAALQLVADAQTGPGRAFWFAVQAFAGLVAEGRLASGVLAKQLFGQVNLQLRRLAQGQTAAHGNVLRDVLFFIASCAEPTDDARAVRRAWRLDGVVPPDYDQRRYGRIDPAALKAAQEALAHAQEAWNRLAAEIDQALEERFEHALGALEEASKRVGSAGLTRLAAELRRVARDSVRSGRGEQFSLEMAAAMLFVEHGLDQIRQLPPEFDAHAEAVGARLLALAAGAPPPPAPAWQGELARRIQESQTVQVLAAEMRVGLRQVEKVLDDYYGDPSKRAALAEADPALHQMQGALALLDQEDAVRGAAHVKDAVRALAAGDGGDERAALENIAQNVGALGFFIDTLAHSPQAARERFEFDVEKGLFQSVPFGRTRGAAAAEAPAAELPEAATPQPTVAAPAPVPLPAADEVEAELLEIFIGEAQEVLATVADTLPAAHAEPSNQSVLTVLRRSFHTLKGSGRMVGLNQFADGAHAVEKVMNLWLAEARAATPDVFALLERAAQDMGVWVGELAASGRSARSSDALVAAAGRVLEGGAFEMEDMPALPTAEVIEMPLPAEPPAPVEAAALPAEAPDNVIEFPAAAAAPAEAPAEEAPAADGARQVGNLEITTPLYNIYLGETQQILRVLEEDFAAWRTEPERPASAAAQKAVHTLTGTSATVGFDALREVAHAFEMAMQALAEPGARPTDAQRDLLDTTVATVRDMLDRFAAGDLAPAQPELVEQLQHLRDHLPRHTGPLPYADAEPELAGQLDNLFEQAYTELIAEPPADTMPALGDLPKVPDAVVSEVDQLLDTAFDPFDAPVLTQVAPPEDVAAPEMSLDFPSVAQAQPDADDALEALAEVTPEPDLEAELPVEAAPLAEPEVAAEAAAAVPPAAEAMAEAPVEAQAEPQAEPQAEEAAPFELELPEPMLAEAPAAHDEAEAFTAAAIPAPQDEEQAEVFALSAAPASDAEELLAPEADDAGAQEAGADDAGHVAGLTDELDPDLLPVFLEEGADLLPRIGNELRAWQQKPSDTAPAQSMQRMLHTVKGSARMAGAMRLGQHTHDIETQIENMVHAGTTTPAAFDELMANYDLAMLMFDQLQGGGVAPMQPAVGAETAPSGAAAGTAAETAQPAARAAEEAPAPGRTPLVRVRADILDRLVNQAGEVSISRSKLETQVGSVKASLTEFSDNLDRLRAQLREVEVQAESQIASRLSITGERHFDPLEFDRFTRLQELTRMMAENVNDVASFHETLSRTVDEATADLAVQSRLTRDLQQDLMRVRMVPFASLSERLFRVARQAAKELDKRVNLDIRGGNVEMDRSVLEQMAAPFEHLLRNAIVHGIEARSKRAGAGKAEIGELLIQASQQGNEVVLAFSDDGAGLDLDRIRAKAMQNGLLEQGQVVSDAEAAELIFEPGFSTADALTELAGRGVGMDVVRSEAQALGGRVAIDSTPGQGTRFTIHLPLTLAVTQVVLTRSANLVYALPGILVEQVLQVKEAPLQAARTAGRLQHGGMALPLHYLPTLLGDTEARPLVQRSSPVLILRHGADRLALLVDEIEGNREVVVKNIGQQLSRMAGIAGATVLGSGDIVLILNPVSLAHHLEHQPATRARVAAPVIDVTAQARVAMVVDDSLTVRKVTQRLLEREGYQVVLAKDGVDALEQVREARPDIMLVDIEMPRMDGFDLARNIRGNDSTRDIPIIMITSRTADKHRNYAADLGVNAYFGKPFPEEALLETMRGLLGQAA